MLLLKKIWANILKQELLCIASQLAKDLVSATLIFARAGDSYRNLSNCLCRFPYHFSETDVIKLSMSHAPS